MLGRQHATGNLLLSVLARRVGVAPPASGDQLGLGPERHEERLGSQVGRNLPAGPDTTRVSITFWNPVRDWMLRWGGPSIRPEFGVPRDCSTTMVGGIMYINYGRNPYGHLAWQATLYDGGSSGSSHIPRGAPEPLHPPGVASQLRTSRMSRSRLTEGLRWWTKSRLQDGSSRRCRARCLHSEQRHHSIPTRHGVAVVVLVGDI